MAAAKDDDLVEDWEALKRQDPSPGPKITRAQPGVLDINELRTTTQKAIQEGNARKRAAEEEKIAAILQRTTERARKEASQGKNSCRVMKVIHERDFTYVGEGPSKSRVIALEGVAKLVFDKLKAARMDVSLERKGGSYYIEDVWILLKW